MFSIALTLKKKERSDFANLISLVYCQQFDNSGFFLFQEKNKILYYHPAKTDSDTQIKNIGLSEAIVKFTEYV